MYKISVIKSTINLYRHLYVLHRNNLTYKKIKIKIFHMTLLKLIT